MKIMDEELFNIEDKRNEMSAFRLMNIATST